MEDSPLKTPHNSRIKVTNVEEYLHEQDSNEIRRKVKKLSLEALKEHADSMPSIISFALLDVEEFIHFMKKLAENNADFTSPMHAVMLYFATDALVMSFVNPPSLCGLFGNGHVNSKGYQIFKSLGMGLEAHWKTMIDCLQTNIHTIPVAEADIRLGTIESIAKLLSDLSMRMGRKSRAIKLAELFSYAVITQYQMKRELKRKANLEAVHNRFIAGRNCNVKLDSNKSSNLYEPPRKLNRTKEIDRSPEKNRKIKMFLDKRDSFSYHRLQQRPYSSFKQVVSPRKDSRFSKEMIYVKENIRARSRTPSFSNSDSSTSDTDSFEGSEGKEYFSSPSPSPRSPFKLTISARKSLAPKMANLDHTPPKRPIVAALKESSLPKGLDVPLTSEHDDGHDSFYGNYKFLSL